MSATGYLRVLTVAILAASIMTGGSGAQAGRETLGRSSGVIQPAPDVAPSSDLDRQIRFRSDLGLPVDPEYIARLGASGETLNLEYGYPVTASEVDYLKRRQAARNEVGPVREVLEATTPEFAGMFFDNEAAYDHGVALSLVVMFTSSPERFRTLIEPMLPVGTELLLRTAAYSYSDLVGVLARVDADRSWHQSLGACPTS